MGADGVPPALWLAGHAAWTADWWIVRDVQAQRGEDADPLRPRLAAADPRSDEFFHAGLRRQACALDLPTPDAVRAWMEDTLETVLDLLATAGDDDRGDDE